MVEDVADELRVTNDRTEEGGASVALVGMLGETQVPTDRDGAGRGEDPGQAEELQVMSDTEGPGARSEAAPMSSRGGARVPKD